MSKYTTEVRYICEVNAGLSESVGFNDVSEIIENSRSNIFNFSYPIFDESYRSVLETKILKHFYTREIGFETVGLWKLKLDSKLNEIMPYYNQLYKSELLEFDVFNDVDYQRKTDRQIDETKSGSRNENSNRNGSVNDNESGSNDRNTTVSNNGNVGVNTSNQADNLQSFSDTPQGGLDGLMSNTYLTNATHNVDSNSGNSITNTSDNGSGTDNSYFEKDRENSYNEDVERDSTEKGTMQNIDDYTEHVFGKTGVRSYSDLLIEFRKTFLNIDVMIIGDLEELFMGIW